jgi:hypothetical protein
MASESPSDERIRRFPFAGGVRPRRRKRVQGASPKRRRVSRQRGRLLAYVFWYTKIHRRPPSESEIADFLGVRGPSAHRMILALEAAGCLSRTPGQPRTLRVLVPRDELPELE